MAQVEKFWPLTPPPEFRVPPPPIPAFVEPCPATSNTQDKMLTNDDLLHLSSYLIVGCILLMVFFTMAACSLRCCTSSTSHDWQREGLLDNCGDDEAEENAVHSDQQQQPTRLLSSLWWQLSSANSLWKQRLRHSIEALRHFGCQPPPEYTINEDAVGSSAPDKPKELTSMDIAEAEQEPHCVVTLRH